MLCKTNNSYKNGRESVEVQGVTGEGEIVQTLDSTAVKWCLGLSVRAPMCALLVTVFCKALFIQSPARTSHTRAKATPSASGLSQLWHSVKSKCCLMFYFLSTNTKERGKKERVGGLGRRERSQLLLQKLQFLSKNLSLASFPRKHFVMHIRV